MEFPDIEGTEYILQHLNALGWCTSNGMGINALSFLEIQAYIELTDTALTADEVLIIKRMSQAYVNELNDKNPHKKIPYGEGKPVGNSFVEALKKAAKKQ